MTYIRIYFRTKRPLPKPQMNRHHISPRLRPLLLLLMVAALATSTALAAHPLAIPGADKTKVGIYIEDLRTGDVLSDVNSSTLFIPASVVKSLTAATVVTEMYPDGCFVTPVDIVGKLSSDGVLDGNIVITVVGDPTIESRHFTAAQGFAKNAAQSIHNAGVRSIKGQVIIDDTMFKDATVPHGWDPADLKYAYGAYPRGANYRDNANGRSSIADPKALMLREVTTALNDLGITVAGNRLKPAADKASTVYAHSSPRVDRILRSLMVRSDNMMAEAMLRILEGGGTRDEALKLEMRLWRERGLDMDGVAIHDGSGLSRADRMSPRFLASLYRWMYNDKASRITYSDLFPRAGRDGTMSNFLKGSRLEGRLAMKTGSMTGVQCFGGYLLDTNGVPTHLVVVLVNDFTCPRATLKKAIADYLLKTLPVQ